MCLSILVTVIAPVCWITLYSLEVIGFGKILIFHTIWWYACQGIWCVPGMEHFQLRSLRRRLCILWRYGSSSALILHLGPGSGGSRTLWFPHLHTWVPDGNARGMNTLMPHTIFFDIMLFHSAFSGEVRWTICDTVLAALLLQLWNCDVTAKDFKDWTMMMKVVQVGCRLWDTWSFKMFTWIQKTRYRELLFN